MLIFQHLLFFLFVTKWLNIVRHIYDVLRTCSTALKDLQVSFTGYIGSYLFIDLYAVKYNITTKHPQINRSMQFFLKDYIEFRQQISDNWTVNWICHINLRSRLMWNLIPWRFSLWFSSVLYLFQRTTYICDHIIYNNYTSGFLM